MEAPLSRGALLLSAHRFGAVSHWFRSSLFGGIPRIARIPQSVGIDEHLLNDGHVQLDWPVVAVVQRASP